MMADYHGLDMSLKRAEIVEKIASFDSSARVCCNRLCKTIALKEGNGFLKLNLEHEAEIVTLPPEQSECCFGHVEFESATSKQNAIQASTIEIGNRIAVIEEKRGTGLTQVDSNRTSSFHRNKLKKHGEDSRSKTSRKGLS